MTKKYTPYRQTLAWIGFATVWTLFFVGVYALTHPVDEREYRVAPETEATQH